MEAAQSLEASYKVGEASLKPSEGGYKISFRIKMCIFVKVQIALQQLNLKTILFQW